MNGPQPVQIPIRLGTVQNKFLTPIDEDETSLQETSETSMLGGHTSDIRDFQEKIGTPRQKRGELILVQLKSILFPRSRAGITDEFHRLTNKTLVMKEHKRGP